KHHKDPLMSIDKAKTSGPLIIVDPVQKNRNASAAVSDESFKKFKSLSNKFLKNPSEQFFKKQPFNAENGLVLEITPLFDKKDIAGTKILKIVDFFKRELEKHDFELKKYIWDFNSQKTLVSLIITPQKLDSKKILLGPKLDMDFHVQKFKEKYS